MKTACVMTTATPVKVYARRAGKVLTVLFWTVIFGFIALDRAVNIYQGYQTSRFPSTEGIMTKADLVESYKSEGKAHFSPSVRFTYSVKGRQTTGDQYRFGNTPTFDDEDIPSFQQRCRVGNRVKVYYDPGNPYRAALITGIYDADIATFGLFLPFNAASILFWFVIIRWSWRRVIRPCAGGVPVRKHGWKTKISLPELTPAGLAAWTLMVGSFVAMAAYLFLPMLGETGLFTAILPGAILLILTFAAYGVQILRTGSGQEDMLVGNGSAELPANFGRKKRIVVPISKIENVAVRNHERFYHKFSVTSYDIILRHITPTGDILEEKLAEWYDRDKAREFALWFVNELTAPADNPRHAK